MIFKLLFKYVPFLNKRRINQSIGICLLRTSIVYVYSFSALIIFVLNTAGSKNFGYGFLHLTVCLHSM
ncbi:hypothetical protein T01_2838 [Trichinella spiralis]|uniref:Uncharacterized protein n=1 Tax=Trichinella spiralis TaxID=6334 RepID=A0A0V1BRE0_TRISP|nr:hypothetical protein T01_2838 [Trichinella spiralis]